VKVQLHVLMGQTFYRGCTRADVARICITYGFSRPETFVWLESALHFNEGQSEFLAAERRCIVSCEVRTEFMYVM
jgi:hypothetical protein